VKDIEEFYTHPRMADGHLGKCRECARLYGRQHYENNIEKYHDYERLKRKRSKDYKKIMAINYRKYHPERYEAHRLTSYGIRTGKIIRQSCSNCGNPKSQAHHNDYSKPYDIDWLCFECHRKLGHGQKTSIIK
jgi:ribosomal protein S27AE